MIGLKLNYNKQTSKNVNTIFSMNYLNVVNVPTLHYFI